MSSKEVKQIVAEPLVTVDASVTADDRRLTRGDLFMAVARLYARRSSCRRASVGAVAIVQGRIIATGYNGAPAGMDDCLDNDCILREGHCIRAIHAEANLIAWAARTGVELNRAHLFSTHAPCVGCSQLILQAGFVTLVYEQDYAEHGLNLLTPYVEVRRHHAGMDIW